GIYFPPVTAFPTPRDDPDGDSDSPRETRRAPRRRPTAEPTTKRPTDSADPGDDGTEVSWMQGLSNRLSAYSLADEDADHDPAADLDGDGPAGEGTDAES